MIGAALSAPPLSLKTLPYEALLSEYGPHLTWSSGIYVSITVAGLFNTVGFCGIFLKYQKQES